MFDFFFFFQAEDGIRDLYVTGVQTCALPISADLRHLYLGHLSRECNKPELAHRVIAERLQSIGATHVCAKLTSQFTPCPRSEERRVGKECRSRWSPYH